ncbi:MAG: phospholipid carrier-dependent glycosyltransferase, partial [Pseudomonadota bacterium]
MVLWGGRVLDPQRFERAVFGLARRHGDLLAPWLIFALTLVFFVWRLDVIDGLIFDESYYVPAGIDLFSLERNSNPQHPPFAKWLIGLGAHIFGDGPFGWRIAGAVLGAATVACVFAATRMLGFSRAAATLATCLTLFNNTVYVQARTAMLDIHMVGLLALSLTTLIWSADAERSRPSAFCGLAIAGVLAGLSASSKWVGGVNFLLVLAGLCIWRTIERADAIPIVDRFLASGFKAWPSLSLASVIGILGGASLCAYIVTFAPFPYLDHHAVAWSGILELQGRIYEASAGPMGYHQNLSPWWEWPFVIEPIWYYFQGDQNVARAQFYVGNLVVYWVGFAAVWLCLVHGLTNRDGAMLAIAAAFLAFWLVWAIIPKQAGWIYYYAPASVLLGPAIAASIERIAPHRWRKPLATCAAVGTIGIFAFFFPVLTGQ